MQKKLWKAAAVVFTAGALVMSSYAGMVAQAEEGIWESCPVGDSSCDGGPDCPHREAEGDTYQAPGDDYGRLTQAELEQLAVDGWHNELEGSLRFGGVLLKTETGETVLLLLEAAEGGMVINAYYKGEMIAGTDVLTENLMMLESYTIILNNGDEKEIKLDTEPAGASAHRNNLMSVSLSGADEEEFTFSGDSLADFFAAIDKALEP